MTLITYQDWYAAGRTRRDLQRALTSGAVRRLRRGVVTDAEHTERLVAEHRLRLRAAAPCLGAQTYFSHFSAAVLHGLPLLAQRLHEVTVVRTAGGHGSVHPTLHARAATLHPSDRCSIGELPVTSLRRTVADLVRYLPFEEAVMLADAALAAGADRAELLALTATGRGCRRAERTLRFADGDSESPGESLSRVRMHQAGIVSPVLQHPIRDAGGQFLGRGDFYWEHVRTIGEFDGAVKYGELAPSGADLARVVLAEKRREQRIRDAGYHVLRWTWPELWDGTLVQRLTRFVGLAG